MSKEGIEYRHQARKIEPAEHTWTLTKEQVVEAVMDYIAKRTGESIPAGKTYLYGLEDRGMRPQRLLLTVTEIEPESEDE